MAVLQIASNVAAVGIDPKYNKFFGNYVRSCVRETVAYFKPNANNTNYDVGSALLICPIRLYDRIIEIKTDARANTHPLGTNDTAGASAAGTYRLALFSKTPIGVELITQLSAADKATTNFVETAQIKTIFSESDFQYLSLASWMKKTTIAPATSTAFETLLNSKYKDETDFYLGFTHTATTENALTYFTTIVTTVDGTPSAQDNARAENIYGSVIVNSAS